MTDPLNDILVDCARMRGSYPLMHRTLNEFAWFCSCAIWGAGPFIDGEIAKAGQATESDPAPSAGSASA